VLPASPEFPACRIGHSIEAQVQPKRIRTVRHPEATAPETTNQTRDTRR